MFVREQYRSAADSGSYALSMRRIVLVFAEVQYAIVVMTSMKTVYARAVLLVMASERAFFAKICRVTRAMTR